MELGDFLSQTRADIKEEISDRMSMPGDVFPYAEMVFTEIVMDHMSEIGMTFDPHVCHYAATIGNARLSLSGYSLSEDADQLDLFVSLYRDAETLMPVPDSETKTAAEQCLRFLTRCVDRRLASSMDQSSEAYSLAFTIQEGYQRLDQIRIYVLTDRVAKTRNFKPREIKGKTVKLEVMDIERLYRHWAAGKPRDEIIIDFREVSGGALPCVYVPGEMEEYDYAMTAMPGETLRFVYEKYGARLLEANVRSFLSTAGKVNKGIRDTLRDSPERFMAYNNGIVIVADEIRVEKAEDGSPGITWMKGMQIVNGGQTTASLYFGKKKNPELDLRRVRIPAKIIILRSDDPTGEEVLISDISRYANSQTQVRLSDLSANKPFHVKLEELSSTTFCPDGVSRWFYERAAGSYQTMLAREGTTPAKLKKLKESLPSSRKIIKTDLAKYLNAWAQKPHLVSLGAQKNFERFMADITDGNGTDGPSLPDVVTYKRMISKSIIFKTTQKLVRSLVPAFQANVTAYTVSVLANFIGDRLDLDTIWRQQALSLRLQEQIQVWAREVNELLLESADGKMVSEWAKKPECWELVVKSHFSPPLGDIPEVR